MALRKISHILKYFFTFILCMVNDKNASSVIKGNWLGVKDINLPRWLITFKQRFPASSRGKKKWKPSCEHDSFFCSEDIIVTKKFGYFETLKFKIGSCLLSNWNWSTLVEQKLWAELFCSLFHLSFYHLPYCRPPKIQIVN